MVLDGHTMLLQIAVHSEQNFATNRSRSQFFGLGMADRNSHLLPSSSMTSGTSLRLAHP